MKFPQKKKGGFFFFFFLLKHPIKLSQTFSFCISYFWSACLFRRKSSRRHWKISNKTVFFFFRRVYLFLESFPMCSCSSYSRMTFDTLCKRDRERKTWIDNCITRYHQIFSFLILWHISFWHMPWLFLLSLWKWIKILLLWFFKML